MLSIYLSFNSMTHFLYTKIFSLKGVLHSFVVVWMWVSGSFGLEMFWIPGDLTQLWDCRWINNKHCTIPVNRSSVSVAPPSSLLCLYHILCTMLMHLLFCAGLQTFLWRTLGVSLSCVFLLSVQQLPFFSLNWGRFLISLLCVYRSVWMCTSHSLNAGFMQCC